MRTVRLPQEYRIRSVPMLDQRAPPHRQQKEQHAREQTEDQHKAAGQPFGGEARLLQAIYVQIDDDGQRAHEAQRVDDAQRSPLESGRLRCGARPTDASHRQNAAELNDDQNWCGKMFVRVSKQMAAG